MWVLALIDHCDLIHRHVRDPFLLIAQIQNPRFHINDISTKRRISSACNLYLLSAKLRQ